MNALFILFILVIIVVSFTIRHLQTTSHKLRIREYLQARAATNIIISKVWLDLDKNTSTYDVRYTNHQGRDCLTSCKIRTGFLGSGEIYWRDPP